MRTRKEYKAEALAALKGNWKPAVLASLILFAITAISIVPAIAIQGSGAMKSILIASLVQYAIIFFVVYPFLAGYYNAFKSLVVEGDANLPKNSWDFTFKNYLRMFGGMFLMYLKVFLWALLLIVPGIIMSIAYAMTPFILKDNPEIGVWKASAKSREMMKGHKWELFVLTLSFILWVLGAICTAGIGFLWLEPWMVSTFADYYEDLKAEGVAPAEPSDAPAEPVAAPVPEA